MRKIDEIIIHCSATPAGRDVSARDIRRWHVNGRGWSDIGYHYVIRLDGTVERGRPLCRVGAHCAGRNARSVGVCYVGGLAADGSPCDTRTAAQRVALHKLVAGLRTAFPGATVHGHNEYAAKACPCFDVRAEFPD